MYQLTVPADRVNESLSKHILADGFDLTYDMEKSHGAYIYDSKYNRTLLDFFTCFASVPLGYNHPKMVNDESFKKNLLLAAMRLLQFLPGRALPGRPAVSFLHL